MAFAGWCEMRPWAPKMGAGEELRGGQRPLTCLGGLARWDEGEVPQTSGSERPSLEGQDLGCFASRRGILVHVLAKTCRASARFGLLIWQPMPLKLLCGSPFQMAAVALWGRNADVAKGSDNGAYQLNLVCQDSSVRMQTDAIHGESTDLQVWELMCSQGFFSEDANRIRRTPAGPQFSAVGKGARPTNTSPNPPESARCHVGG
ncbi:hypothetical protein AK812_SmicGene33443 [Symbiodinium microadriaticum]|uniref:Uncharacterized protein n=1 Tax=Symbiodinium microadriaticum TaxID=2951 RepID=A0A1Q9CRK3_SYMMI|nr:hypothetical protein AK812_SmicGene33443 [Symbiodinium microadriaticum]